jgi:flagellar hook-associated protein 3 FlgL
MRVTTNSSSNALREQLNNLAQHQNRLQSQAASSQSVQSISDDPGAGRRVFGLKAERSEVAQFQQNIAALQDSANASYAAIKSLKTVSDRAGEIATSADGLKSAQDLAIHADQVTQLIEQAVQAANSQQNGSYLFAGTRSNQPPFVTTTNANGRVTRVTYQGNESVASSPIAESTLTSTQVIGANTSGLGQRGLITDTAAGADFFNHLISLQNNLATGNTDAIANTNRTQLAADEDNLLYHISQNGAVQSRLKATASITSDRAAAIDSQVSKAADADLAQTLLQFNATQNAYQAALQTGAKMLNLGLLNYLQ